jgi:hypothetical protein
MRLMPSVCLAAMVLSASCIAAQQGTSPNFLAKGKKVCVAEVANSSLKPVNANSVKDRLLQELQKEHVNVFDAPSHTMLACQQLSAERFAGRE